MADKDRDGMSDLWESSYGFSTNGNASPDQTANADPDGDGTTNLQESIAGTNPLSSSGYSGLHRANISKNPLTAGAFNLEWRQLIGKEYQVIRSNNLATWTALSAKSVSTTDANFILPFIPVAQDARAFFRVAVNDIDPDADNLTSHEESQIGSNPGDPDSDSDEIFDGFEYQYGGLAGLLPDADLDNDGLTNLGEFLAGSNPAVGDSDNDGITDAAEAEQESEPSDGNDRGVARKGAIRLRVATGTLLGPTYPFDTGFFPVYPINIYKRNLSTGVETLLHSVPTGNAFNAQNIDLPNDGSVYSLQVDLPFYGSEFGLPLRDFRWICSCFARVGSAPVAIIDSYNPATNTIGMEGSLVSGVPKAYDSNFASFRALIIPVNIDYVSRDPKTGVVNQSSPTEVYGSDARPDVTITNVATSINTTGQLSITVSGIARDQLSEMYANSSGAVNGLDVYFNGNLVDTITNLSPQTGGPPIRAPWQQRDSTVAFTKTIIVDDVAEGMHSIRLFSNANVISNKGTDGVTVLVEKQNYEPSSLANPPDFAFTLPGSFSTTVVDSIDITSGANSATLTEDPLAPNSRLFSGTLMLNGVARDFAVQLDQNASLDAAQLDKISAEVTWRVGIQTARVGGFWAESTVNSLNFAAIPASIETKIHGSNNSIVSHIKNDPNILNRGINPYALRLEVPDNFNFLGASGLLTTELNGNAVSFNEAPALLPYPPPSGKKWFYLGAAGAPQLFAFNPALAGTSFYPSNFATAKRFDLKVKRSSSGATAFENSRRIDELFEFPSLKPPTPPLPAPGEFAPLSLQDPAYTIEEVRFWFEFIFDDAGKVLLERYEAGAPGSSDFGLVVSLQTFWRNDGDAYRFQYTYPFYSAFGTAPKTPQLYLNRSRLATPIDAATALFTALQELRKTGNLLKRSSLEIDWTQILDNYLNNTPLADPDIDKALRESRLGAVTDVLTEAKSAFELGFSFVPGGEILIGINDVDTQIIEGNMKGAAVTAAMFFTPEIVDRVGKYAFRKNKIIKVNLGNLANNIDVTSDQFKELTASGIFEGGNKLSRSQKIAVIDDLLSRNAITRDLAGALYDSGKFYLKESRKPLNRDMARVLGPPNGKKAHHDFPHATKAVGAGGAPVNLEKQFIVRGLDANLAENARYIDEERHLILHGKGTTGWPGGDPFIHQWVRFFDEFPGASKQRVLEFRDELRLKTADIVNGTIVNGAVTNANNVQWPYPKL